MFSGDIDVRRTKGNGTVEVYDGRKGVHTFSFDQEAQTIHVYLPKSCKVAFYRED